MTEPEVLDVKITTGRGYGVEVEISGLGDRDLEDELSTAVEDTLVDAIRVEKILVRADDEHGLLGALVAIDKSYHHADDCALHLDEKWHHVDDCPRPHLEAMERTIDLFHRTYHDDRWPFELCEHDLCRAAREAAW